MCENVMKNCTTRYQNKILLNGSIIKLYLFIKSKHWFRLNLSDWRFVEILVMIVSTGEDKNPLEIGLVKSVDPKCFKAMDS